MKLRHVLCAVVLPLCCSTLLFAAEPAARRKVIIDQDAFGPGGSNLQSVLMLLQAPDVDVLGITVVSGDGWRDEEVDHVLRLLEVAGRTDVPVYAGAVFPLLNSQNRTLAWERRFGPLVYKGAWTERSFQGVAKLTYHADPYLVPLSPAGKASTRAQAESAAAFMIRAVRADPGMVTIWCGGPMTNVALAARLDPEFSALAKELVFMGGSFNPKAADNKFANEYLHAPRREFNMRWDPEAASLVLHEHWRKITQVPIDPTTKTLFSAPLHARLSGASRPFTEYLLRFARQLPMWDELAAAVWIDPSLVTRRETLLVDVESSDGAAYGDTLSWPLTHGPGLGEQQVEVVKDVDLVRFENAVVKLLTQAK